MSNTNTEATLTTADISTIVALDAVEQAAPARGQATKAGAAAALLVGCPATIDVGSDSYGAVVVSATASLKTIVAEYRTPGGLNGQRLTFRLTAGGSYRQGSSRYLRLGTAVTRWDESF